MRKTKAEWAEIHKAELAVLCRFLTEPKNLKQITDELPIVNLPQKLRKWSRQGILKYTKVQQSYFYVIANYEYEVPEKTNSTIYRLLDTVHIKSNRSREKNYVSGSTLTNF